MRVIGIAGILALALLATGARPARADFSACESAFQAKDVHQQIVLYTGCLKHGGLTGTDVSSAFNNRGVAYEQIGEIDKAFADFTAAIQYDPNWPRAYENRAFIEAGRGKCDEAQADISHALKLAPHEKQYLDARDKLAGSCPIAPKPSN